MFIGPVFSRELVTTPRRPRFYIYRTVYILALFVLMCTAWLVLTGTQVIRNIGDMARFGTILFYVLAPLQLWLVVFFSSLLSASAVAQEKDKKTLILLLLTRLTNHELVLGKLLASLLNVLVLLLAALPVFMLSILFGGVSMAQVGRVYAVTAATALAAGSLGSTLALWREKTFQTLALTALVLVFWLAGWEAIHSGLLGSHIMGLSSETWAVAGSPMRAILEAARPSLTANTALGLEGGSGVNLFLIFSVGTTAVLNLVAIWRVRVWNPSRELRTDNRTEESLQESIWGVDYDLEREENNRVAEDARTGHVDARIRPANSTATASRRVWDNPILWREICTWAYGRKVLVIRFAYILLLLFAAAALSWSINSGAALSQSESARTVVPAAAKSLLPFYVVSLVIINALAVTSITGERDGQALDLLLVSDLSPKEFVFGKLGGVFWVTKEMMLAPLLLSAYLCWAGGLSLENLVYVMGGLLVMDVFVAVLGIHCGMTYADSRSAIGVSIGTILFLFLGVATCIRMMISFSGSFQMQLPPFLAFIGGGGIGLYVTLGSRNPSQAIGWASLIVPFATFYAIVSFLRDLPLAVFLVTVATYSFTTAAMLIPALFEFDFAMGRTTTAEE